MPAKEAKQKFMFEIPWSEYCLNLKQPTPGIVSSRTAARQ